MELTSGSRLGPYEIVSRIGAGGMGEVFRARDRRLERNVAIKVLPHEFADDAEIRLRFEREAKSISQLNDPHSHSSRSQAGQRDDHQERRGAARLRAREPGAITMNGDGPHTQIVLNWQNELPLK